MLAGSVALGSVAAAAVAVIIVVVVVHLHVAVLVAVAVAVAAIHEGVIAEAVLLLHIHRMIQGVGVEVLVETAADYHHKHAEFQIVMNRSEVHVHHHNDILLGALVLTVHRLARARIRHHLDNDKKGNELGGGEII